MKLRQLPGVVAWIVLSAAPAACDDGKAGAPTRAATLPAHWQYKSVLIDSVPHVRQKTDFCGEACVEMWLRKLGFKNWDQDRVFDKSGLNPLEARGCYTKELVRAVKNIGFVSARAWSSVSAARAGEEMEKQWRALHDDLVAGAASIVCTRYGGSPRTTEHFRLVLGYDAAKSQYVDMVASGILDPAKGVLVKDPVVLDDHITYYTYDVQYISAVDCFLVVGVRDTGNGFAYLLDNDGNVLCLFMLL